MHKRHRNAFDRGAVASFLETVVGYLSCEPFTVRESAMITGMHAIVYTRDAEGDRAFFRDVLSFPFVDAGQGWLIFALPPSELAFHPAEGSGGHEVYLMCDDVKAECDRLKRAGVECGKISDEGWGLLTTVRLPGGSDLGLYQPKHPIAHGTA